MVYAAYRVARVAPATLWSPTFWLLTTFAVFYGFGPLVEIYGNAETQLRLSVQKIAISEIELFMSNQLSIVSINALLFGFWLHTSLAKERWRAALSEARERQQLIFSPETITVAFIVGGMVLVHVFIRPSQWEQIDIVVPGALASVGAIADVGFALALFLATRGSKKMRLIFGLLWPLHLLLSALSFAKASLMIALVLPAVGAYLGHRRITMLALALLAITGVFSASQDYVTYGRAEIVKETGTIWKAGYLDRLQIAQSYFSSTRSEENLIGPTEEMQTWWLRLNYSNVQAIGMRYREEGIFIDSLSDIWMRFVPRILWPDKPIYLGPGIQFYELITGRKTTSVGISVFGDVFWQFGWTGSLFIMPAIGWMFAMMSWRSIEAVTQRDFIWMPLVLLSILTSATGLNKWLANGIIAVIPIYVSYLLLVQGISLFIRKRQLHGRIEPEHFSQH